MAFGHPFPRTFGVGPGKSLWEQEIDALLDAYAPGWARSSTSQSYAEVRPIALAVTLVWLAGRRAANALIPAKMLSTLPTWEASLHLNPLPTDSLQSRRASVAARLLGLAGNSISQIETVVSGMAGPSFVGLVFAVTPVSYMPGISLGPPGFEWCSTLATVAVALTAPLDLDLARRIRVELQNVMPAWMTAQIGTQGGGFVPGVGIPGVSLL